MRSSPGRTLQANARMVHCGRMTDATRTDRCRHESRTPTSRRYTGSMPLIELPTIYLIAWCLPEAAFCAFPSATSGAGSRPNTPLQLTPLRVDRDRPNFACWFLLQCCRVLSVTAQLNGQTGTLPQCSNAFIRRNGPCSIFQVSVFHANVRTKS